MRKIKNLIGGLVIILLGLPVYSMADAFLPEPLCFEPTQPLMFSPSSYRDRYERDVKKYELCISEFVSRQEQAILKHQKAIEQAQKMLKKYVD